MKLKSRKMVSAIVAAFLIVVLAGSAFAFGTGVLTFEGRATIDTNLQVDVYSVRALSLDTFPFQHVAFEISECNQTVTFTFPDGFFDNLYGTRTTFAHAILKNTGTVPATIGNPTVVTSESTGGVHQFFDVEWLWQDVNENFINPVQRTALAAELIFDTTGFEGTSIQGEFVFEVTFPYEWVRGN